MQINSSTAGTPSSTRSLATDTSSSVPVVPSPSDGPAQAASKVTVRSARGDFAQALVSVGLDAADALRVNVNDRSTFSVLTPDDRSLVYATTGLILSSDGVVQNGDASKQMSSYAFIGALSAERESGAVTDNITAADLKPLFEWYSPTSGDGDRAVLDPDDLLRALQYIDQRDGKLPDGTTFNVYV